MLTMYYPAQIEQLKRKAKQSAHSLNIPHSAALDQVARDEGFPNWSLLMRHNQDVVPYRFERSDEEWKLALRPIKDGDPWRPATHGPRFEAINAKFISAYNAVAFAVEYMQSLLARPRYRIHHGSLAFAQMRWWLPYCVHDVEDDSGRRVLLNRHYKPVGLGVNEHVDYARFISLHVSLSFEQLKSFSNHGKPRGYLFNDGNAPWSNRADATTYAERLDRLGDVLLMGSPADSLTAWSETRHDIFQAIDPWARIGTWYTGHPADEKRLSDVLVPLRARVHGVLREEDLRAALRAHRSQNTEILGGKASDAVLERFVQRITRWMREA